jgi:hypothetical protein
MNKKRTMNRRERRGRREVEILKIFCVHAHYEEKSLREPKTFLSPASLEPAESAEKEKIHFFNIGI